MAVPGGRGQPEVRRGQATTSGPRRSAPPVTPGSAPPRARDRRRQRRRDPLRQYRAVVGDDARVQWTDRVRAIFLLILWIIVLGLAVAGFIGLMLFAGSLALEILAE